MAVAEHARPLSKRIASLAVACGYPSELCTMARAGALPEVEFGRMYSTVQVWPSLRELGFSSQRPTGRALQREKAANLARKQQPAGAKVKSRAEGRTLVFVDESGLSQRPTRVKAQSPKGQNPLLQYSFN